MLQQQFQQQIGIAGIILAARWVQRLAHTGGHRRGHREQMQGLILVQHENQSSPASAPAPPPWDDGQIVDTADPPRPPPPPQYAPTLRFRATPSPRPASTTHAFYLPNRYSRTPRTVAP